jgi:small subunit ribosomal protein S11
MAKATAKKTAARPKRRERKNIDRGAAHIHSSFNNTIVTITDPAGYAVSWASAGGMGMKGSRKGSPFAAQWLRNQPLKRYGSWHAFGRGLCQRPGAGREAENRSLQASRTGCHPIKDVTPIPIMAAGRPKEKS